MSGASPSEVLKRIQQALDAAVQAISPFIPATTKVHFKVRDDPVTEVDRLANDVLRDLLVRDGEGWLSEESEDDLTRLKKTRVWMVDPIDGTREFVEGVPEWCVSIGLIESGLPVAGGICNPAKGETFLGSLETGTTLNGKRVCASRKKALAGATLLASRSEMKRGEWEPFGNAPFSIRPMGSVAYKLALVAAGLADATWTLCPKHEWDVAAGVALVKSSGGFVREVDNDFIEFNTERCLLPNLLAGGPYLSREISLHIQKHRNVTQAARTRSPLVGHSV